VLKSNIILALTLITLTSHASDDSIKDEKFKIFLRKIENPASTVIVSHGSDCSTRHPNNFASKLNNWGFNAVVIDHCVNRGIKSHVSRLSFLSPWDRSADLQKTALWIKGQAWHKGKIGAVGYSQGGAGVIAANDYQIQNNLGVGDDLINSIDAFVAFYPGCDIAFPPNSPNKPIMIHHGKKDQLALVAKCPYGRLSDIKYEIKLYEDAHHSFDMGVTATLCKEILGCVVTAEPNTKALEESDVFTKEFLQRHLNK
jgi:dienelactone hydrolase